MLKFSVRASGSYKFQMFRLLPLTDATMSGKIGWHSIYCTSTCPIVFTLLPRKEIFDSSSIFRAFSIDSIGRKNILRIAPNTTFWLSQVMLTDFIDWLMLCFTIM